MADLDDMEMVECPHCKKVCPRDFYPLCTCEQNLKEKSKEKATAKKGAKKKLHERLRP